MELPLDIRLLIYDELLVEGVNLYRTKCHLCSTRKSYRSIYSTCVPKLVCTQILRTSKQIYSEAVERLYSRNTVQIQCRDCSKTDASKSWLYWVGLDDFPCAGIDYYCRHVKNVAIVYQLGNTKADSWFPHFSKLWPGIEEKILALYKNTKRISLRIRSNWTFDIALDLFGRSSKSSTERVHDYVNMLAQNKWFDEEYDAASALAALEKTSGVIMLLDNPRDLKDTALAILEEICDEVVLSSDLGALKDTTFAVQRIRWKPSLKGIKEFDLYLGCDKHSANDTLLESILAKRDSRKKGIAA